MSDNFSAIIRGFETCIARKDDLEERYATSSQEVFEELQGSVPLAAIEEARSQQLIFCADCGHVSGFNADACENCFDHKYARSEFVIHSRWPSD